MAEEQPPGKDLGFSAAVFVAALLPRLYVAIAWAREPVWDGHYYDFGARRIAAGLGYSDDVVTAAGTTWHPWCHFPVGYSAFLGLVYKVFGSGPHVATVANAVVAAVTVVLVHRLARYALSPWRARVAALLAALAPGLIVYTALLMTEPLAATGVLAAALLAARDARSRPIRGALLGGALLGLTTLVRPQSILCAPALALFALAAEGAGTPWRARLRRAGAAAGVATAAALVVVAPWTARNCRVMDGCAFVSTNGGWNLAIGAFPRATGRFETLRSSDGCREVTGQVQQDRCWMDAGKRWILADPKRWLGLVPKKLGFTFDHESFPVGYLGEADPGAWPEPRRAAARHLLSTAHRLLLFGATLGMIALPALGSFRDRRARAGAVAQAAALAIVAWLAIRGFDADDHPFWPLALLLALLAAAPLPGAPPRAGPFGYIAFLVASVAATHAVFFGEDRYHMVLTPALCILAAGALRSGARAKRSA